MRLLDGNVSPRVLKQVFLCHQPQCQLESCGDFVTCLLMALNQHCERKVRTGSLAVNCFVENVSSWQQILLFFFLFRRHEWKSSFSSCVGVFHFLFYWFSSPASTTIKFMNDDAETPRILFYSYGSEQTFNFLWKLVSSFDVFFLVAHSIQVLWTAKAYSSGHFDLLCEAYA